MDLSLNLEIGKGKLWHDLSFWSVASVANFVNTDYNGFYMQTLLMKTF